MKRFATAATILVFLVPSASTMAASPKPATQAAPSGYDSPVITDAWARATVPGQPVGAGYMKITSHTTVVLEAAVSDVAKEVQVHNMHMHEGVMQMRKHGQLELPAGKTVELAPGGMHLMLLGLKKPLKVGEEVSMTLTFTDKQGTKTSTVVILPVRPIGQ